MGWLRAAKPLVVLAMLAGAFTVASPAQAGPIAWCGSGEPSTDLPDALLAVEWHVIYAIPADGQDRFAYYAPRIVGDVAAVSNWWIAQDATRRPRFDLLDAPGCPTEFQRIDISVAHLPHANGDESYNQVQTDLRAQGFASADKGYLVYYDGSFHAGDEYGVCGEGGVSSGPRAYSMVYLQTCNQSSGDDSRADTVAHEMTHGMGAVQPGAPNRCNGGHVCDSPNDLMKAVKTSGETLGDVSLDVGHDDYYAHSGSWYDVQDSGLLFHLDSNLPPAPPVTATATNIHDFVQVNWFPVPSENGLYYRVYGADGTLIQDLPYSTLTASGASGQTLTWTIQSEDFGGSFGPPTTLRFKVGYGIVDATGTVTKDTVVPGDVTSIRASRSGRNLLVRWTPVSDPIGLRGYKVTAPGLTPLLVKSASVTLSLAKVRGKKITVVAIDEAGNAGYPASIVAPR